MNIEISLKSVDLPGDLGREPFLLAHFAPAEGPTTVVLRPLTVVDGAATSDGPLYQGDPGGGLTISVQVYDAEEMAPAQARLDLFRHARSISGRSFDPGELAVIFYPAGVRKISGAGMRWTPGQAGELALDNGVRLTIEVTGGEVEKAEPETGETEKDPAVPLFVNPTDPPTDGGGQAQRNEAEEAEARRPRRKPAAEAASTVDIEA